MPRYTTKTIQKKEKKWPISDDFGSRIHFRQKEVYLYCSVSQLYCTNKSRVSGKTGVPLDVEYCVPLLIV